MKKQLLSFSLLLFSFLANAQYDYTPTGRNDVPVKGMTWGLVGGGFTSMLNNRDDIEADKRLDPQMMNFNWAAGIECIYWFQPSIGVGGQAMYWNGGAAYTGLIDSASNITMKAKTSLTYIKVPILFHFKSYHRYYPDRRVRFSAQFGPYVALLNKYSDDMSYYNNEGLEISNVNVSGNSYQSGLKGEIKGKLSGQIYNPLDVGFVAGVGGEIRLWRRTVIALNIRTDIGITNVENTRGLKITYDSDNTKDYDYKTWKNLYAKFTAPTAVDAALGWVDNRPPTKNFSVGAFLTIRKYLSY